MRLFAAFLLLIGTLGAQIKDPAKDTAAGDPMVDLYRSLADYFRISERAVYLVRDKIGRDDEVAAVLLLTKRSPASANQVIDARKAGKDWAAITKQFKVKQAPANWVEYANTYFLSQYHGRTEKEVQDLRAKGADWVAINQQFRRDPATPPAQRSKTR